MKPWLLFLLFVNIAAVFGQERRVLVFSKTAGYVHESIPAGITAIRKMGKEHGFAVDTTKNAAYFTDDNLKKYAALIFLSPSGDLFSDEQKEALTRYIHAGGGFVGIHAATTPEKNWTWYGQLVGAVFVQHPEAQTGTIRVDDKKHPSTKHMPAQFSWKDEWYNFRDVQKDLHVLFSVDESSYKGGQMGAYHPLAWYHEFEGGRSFYTAIGHFAEAYSDPVFQRHILAGISYAMGKKNPDYSKLKE